LILLLKDEGLRLAHSQAASDAGKRGEAKQKGRCELLKPSLPLQQQLLPCPSTQ